MFRKPFKPPLLAQRPPSDLTSKEFSIPEAKRRRLNVQQPPSSSASTSSSNDGASTNTISRETQSLFVDSTVEPDNKDTLPASAGDLFYNVLWRKPTGKKHKTWDGDGFLVISNGSGTLYDGSGKVMGVTKHSTPLFTGSALYISGKEIEVDSSMTRADFTAAMPFAGSSGKPTVRELDEQLRTNVKFNSRPSSTQPKIPAKKPKDNSQSTQISNHVPSEPKAPSTQFKSPLQITDATSMPIGPGPTPRHDPAAPDAVVMTRLKHSPKDKAVVDVVVDPILSKCLREHQKEGVKFMYDCVMGMKPQGINGCILADEMGLGKTLQVITLIWTLLKQNPMYGDPPVVKKAVVVCPVTVIKNWKKEFRKWLGDNRIGVFVLDGQKARLKDFTRGRTYNVMIIGYERLRTIQDELQKCDSIDIVVADEGHRLKTAGNKSAQAIKALNTDRRIMLSGTPLQNDLSEFYFAVDMVNPGLLSKANIFKREFETPILRSRQPDASAKEIERGEARSAELAELTNMFMLRRGSEILAKYLPPKTETLLFCRPTSVQASVYRTVLSSPVFGAVLRSTETAFKLIDTLKKLCNSPNLLKKKRESEDTQKNETLASLLAEIPSALLKFPGASGKLQVLDSLLHLIRTTTDEKVVIVSHYTSTLDIIGGLLESLSHRFLRLDGNTPTSKRQGLVDQFNRTDAEEHFAFLLSAKAGGAGINLIGASRLILFDVDWNPSTDEQAMARIHRDGQRKHCRIYRLLTQGALDEKIFQRQVSKRALADSVVDGKVSASTFTADELQRLFELDESSACQTHSLLGCVCEGKGNNARNDNVDDDETEDGPKSEPEDDDDESLPDLPTLVSASQVDIKAEEERMEKHKQRARGGQTGEKQRMLALMQYEHYDPNFLTEQPEEGGLDLLNDDDVLFSLLKDSEHKVGYIFTKTKTPASI